MLTVHLVLGIATFLLLCTGIYYGVEALETHKHVRIMRRIEQVHRSIAATPAEKPWQLRITVYRLKLFIMNPALPLLILTLAIALPSQSRITTEPQTGLYILPTFFFLFYLLLIATNLPGFGTTVLVLRDDGIETYWNGFILWSKIEEINLQSAQFKGVDLKSLSIKVSNPLTTITRLRWKDRFLAFFRLGVTKNGTLHFPLDYASEDIEVIYSVADALWCKHKGDRYHTGNSSSWRTQYFKKLDKRMNDSLIALDK
jgi:hypothetical protein